MGAIHYTTLKVDGCLPYETEKAHGFFHLVEELSIER
jgi:hypothetical protein